MRRVTVIGGGISGLATAALLAQDGWSVDLLEQRDELGGRAGTWSSDGFRFDTGPSWYLMPEVFDHFFRLLGTTAREQLELVRLDPGYRVFFEGEEQPVDVLAGRDENVALFESLEPGAGHVLEEYLDSAADTTRMAVDHFLYTSFDRPTNLAHPQILRRLPRSARCSVVRWSRTSRRASTTTACARSWATPPCSWARRPRGRRACTT